MSTPVLILTFIAFTGFIKPSEGSELYRLPPIGNIPSQFQVWSLKITGNKTYSDIVLKNAIATRAPSFIRKLKFWDRGGFPYSETEVQKDVIRLEHFYRNRGFPHVRVTYSVTTGNREWKKKVVFHITEGVPLIISAVQYQIMADSRIRRIINDDARLNKLKKQLAYRAGKRYQEVLQPESQGKLTTRLKDIGFPYAEVQITAQSDTVSNKTSITIKMNPGPLGYISDIIVSGQSTVSKQLVIRQSGLHVGRLFSQAKLNDAQQAIYNHPLFRFVVIDVPDQPHDSTVTVTIQVKEHKLRTLKLSLGFGSEEYLRGQASWTDRNLFGNANDLTLSGHASFIQQQFGIDYLFPYVFNNKSSFVITPFINHEINPGYELMSGGITNSLVYQYNRYLTSSVSYQYTRNNIVEQSSNFVKPDSAKLYDISSLQIGAYYRRNFLGTRNGWIINPNLELSGMLHTGSYTYQKASIDIHRLISLDESRDLVFRTGGGLILDTKRDTLPQNILFMEGGVGSVRGWYRDQLGSKRAVFNSDGSFRGYVPEGGRAMFYLNVEFRQNLNFIIHGLGTDFFIDTGQVWQTLSDVTLFGNDALWGISHKINMRALQFGVGGGFSYQSPIGPIRLDVGYKVNPSLSDLDYYQGTYHGSRSWKRIAFHFSIGQTF